MFSLGIDSPRVIMKKKKTINTPDRWQSKTLLTMDERRSKITRNSVLIAICRQPGHKWQVKTLFLKIFVTHWIAAYRV